MWLANFRIHLLWPFSLPFGELTIFLFPLSPLFGTCLVYECIWQSYEFAWWEISFPIINQTNSEQRKWRRQGKMHLAINRSFCKAILNKFWLLFKKLIPAANLTGYRLWTRRSSFCVQLPSGKHIWWVSLLLSETSLLGPSCDLKPEMYRYKVGCDLPGKYRVALDSDASEFGGHGRVRKSFIPHNHAFHINQYGTRLAEKKNSNEEEDIMVLVLVWW